MKIVYLHQYFRTPEMNGGTRSYEMARRWVSKGHAVDIVTTDAGRSGGGWRTYEIEGVTVHACAVQYSNSMSFRRRIQAFIHFAVTASWRARKLNGDLVFATSTPLTIVIPGLFATVLRQTPMVFEVRDLWPEVPIAVGALKNPVAISLARGLEWLAYRCARKVVALSPGMAEGVVARGIQRDKVVIAPNSCDLVEFSISKGAGERYRQEQPWLGSRPLVVYCGTLGIINNVGYLVDVANAMKDIDPDIAFGIYGTGAEHSFIRQKAKELGILDRNLFMLGELRKKEVPKILDAATVCTSLFRPIEAMQANSANKFFDALAAGKPIAINYGGWQADLLRESGAGLVLDPSSTENAARELQVYIRDPHRRERAGRAGRLLAERDFGRDRISDVVLNAMCAATRPSVDTEVSNGPPG